MSERRYEVGCDADGRAWRVCGDWETMVALALVLTDRTGQAARVLDRRTGRVLEVTASGEVRELAAELPAEPPGPAGEGEDDA